MSKLSKEEAAYVAGFLDSDGCISLKRHNNGAVYPTLIWHQVRPESVVFLRHKFNGSLFLLERGVRLRNGKTITERRQLGIGFGAEATLNILRQVIPYLQIKAEQAKLLTEEVRGVAIPPERSETVIGELRKTKKRIIDPKKFVWGQIQEPRFSFSAANPQLRIPTAFKYLRSPKEYEKAYIAGLIDGDGSVNFTDKVVVISLGQAETKGVEFVRSIYGGSVTLEHHNHANKPMAVFRTGMQGTTLQMASDMFPYLKEKQLEFGALLHLWFAKRDTETLRAIFEEHRSYEITDAELEVLREEKLFGYQKPVCSICGESRLAGAGYCHKHYERFQKYGDPRLFLKQKSRRSYELARENEDGSITWKA